MKNKVKLFLKKGHCYGLCNLSIFLRQKTSDILIFEKKLYNNNVRNAFIHIIYNKLALKDFNMQIIKSKYRILLRLHKIKWTH